MIQDIQLEKISMAIFWKSLQELDIYTVNNMVKTIKGDDTSQALELLTTHNITVDIVE
jgi:hypothetical protein